MYLQSVFYEELMKIMAEIVIKKLSYYVYCRSTEFNTLPFQIHNKLLRHKPQSVVMLNLFQSIGLCFGIYCADLRRAISSSTVMIMFIMLLG